MNNQKIVCIDFGSAYTKIAVRPNWDESADLIRKTAEAAADAEFCIPSVVARVRRSRGDHWLIGASAAGQIASSSVKVYRYWKADLFSTKTNGGNGKLSHTECAEVAIAYFRELRSSLKNGHLAECPVRICIPKLSDPNLHKKLIMDILVQAGWQLAADATVYEPESNTCGVLTRGRNQTWMPPGVRTRHPNLLQMFGKKGALGAVRGTLLRGSTGPYGVLVTDLGAFTTDFGFIKFDDSFFNSKLPRPEVVQLSRALGVRDLDNDLVECLSEEAQSVVSTLSMTEWEGIKRLLYEGKPAALRNPKGGVLKIGDKAERPAMTSAIEAFAQKVGNAQRDFCRQQVKTKIRAHVLTGGGFLIAGIRETLIKTLGDDSDVLVYDLLDQEEPHRALNQKKSPSGPWIYDQGEVDARLRQNQELLRGGSSVGGASVFFERW